jgi:hypothetical protein
MFVVDEWLAPGTNGRRTVGIPLNAEGQPVPALYLDGLTPFVLAVYLLFAEWGFGTTCGKSIVGFTVHGA